jgi:hypothetical protein
MALLWIRDGHHLKSVPMSSLATLMAEPYTDGSFYSILIAFNQEEQESPKKPPGLLPAVRNTNNFFRNYEKW